VNKLFEYWDWEDTVAALFAAFVMFWAVVLGVSACADHRVHNYYLRGGMDSHVTCVYGEVNWGGDNCVMCSPDNNAALDFARKANELLAQRK
jgi:hypothetical protein